MQPIPVRAFHQDRVSVRQSLRIVHDGRISKSQVTAEHQDPFPFGTPVAKFDNG